MNKGAEASLAEMLRRGESYCGHKLWTPEDDAALIAAYPDYAAAHAALPKRTLAAIKHRAFVLGIQRPLRVWEAGESGFTRRRYPSEMPVQEIGEFVGKTKSQIWRKGQSLGVQRPKRRPKVVADPIMHEIRQRAFDLNITLTELGDEVGASGYFLHPRPRHNARVVVRALEALGGRYRFGAA